MKKSSIISYVVVVFSIFEILTFSHNGTYLPLIISVIGVLGFVLYLLKKDFYKPLYLLWIFAQLPIISSTTINEGIKVTTDILNLSQFIKIDFGFSLTKIPYTYRIAINIFPILFLYLYKIEASHLLISKTITILPENGFSTINDNYPQEAEITEVSNKFDFKGVLKKTITIENIDYNKVIFKTVDKSAFKIGKNRQKCNIRYVDDKHKNTIEKIVFIK